MSSQNYEDGELMGQPSRRKCSLRSSKQFNI